MVDITATIESPEEISVTIEGGIQNFLGLTDTPTDYSGESGKVVAVKSTEDGLEFTTAGAGSGDVTGPSSAVNENITVFDSTTGKIIKDSTINISAVTANTAKDTNVSTDLSEGTSTETTVNVNSSDGTNATLVSASTSRAGLLTKAKFDEIVVNNAKVTYDDASAVSSNTTHRGLTNDPHNVTQTQVGLSNVSNVATDDTAYNSTSWNTNTDAATKNALRDKFESLAGGHDPVTLNASATTGGMTLSTQEISNRAATNSQTGYMTSSLVGNIETNNSKNTNVSTNLSAGTLTATTIDVNSSDGTNATLVEADTTNAGILGSDKWDEIVANSVHTAGDGSDHADVATNTSKVSFTKTNVKGQITHGGTAGTSRPTGFTSVEWQGTVEPSNSVNGDTWIDES